MAVEWFVRTRPTVDIAPLERINEYAVGYEFIPLQTVCYCT